MAEPMYDSYTSTVYIGPRMVHRPSLCKKVRNLGSTLLAGSFGPVGYLQQVKLRIFTVKSYFSSLVYPQLTNASAHGKVRTVSI